MDEKKRKFIEMSIDRGILFEQSKTKSGLETPYYFHVGNLNSGKDLTLIGNCLSDLVLKTTPDITIVFGIAKKGIPIALATSIALKTKDKEVHLVYNKKDQKGYGDDDISNQLKYFSSEIPSESIIGLFDDVIQSARTKLEVVDLIREHTNSSQIKGLFVLLDRQENVETGRSASKYFHNLTNIPVYSIINAADICEYCLIKDRKDDVIKVSQHLKQYGTDEAKQILSELRLI